jgi:hypothetical protein
MAPTFSVDKVVFDDSNMSVLRVTIQSGEMSLGPLVSEANKVSGRVTSIIVGPDLEPMSSVSAGWSAEVTIMK